MDVIMNILENAYNIYSQCGQDGILDYVFNVLNISKGFFIEFGAVDGIKFSNTRNLYEKGWSGILIESNKKRYSNLENNYRGTNVITINSFVNNSNNKLDDIIGENDITFLSIDIDGADLEIFESINKNLPIVALIEGGMGPYPYENRVNIKDTPLVGQSLRTIKEVAAEKGYKILCVFQDCLLIKKEYFNLFDVPDLITQYKNAYLYHPRYNIPIYNYRLNKLGRENPILRYILNRTDYKNTPGKGKRKQLLWANDKRQEIDLLLGDDDLCQRFMPIKI